MTNSNPTEQGELHSSPLPKIVVALVLLVLTLISCWPALIYGLPDWGNDAIDHARWAKHFGAQFWGGELYPRWLAGVNGGLGAPVLFIYPPLPSYGATLFYPLLGATDPYGFRLIGMSCILSVLISGFGAYRWCRTMADSRASLFAACLYIIVPYHLAVNLYTRGAAAELWAIAWMPWILLATSRVIDGSKWAVPGLIAVYALLVYSHLPTTVCFSLAPLVMPFFLADTGRKLRTAALVAGCMTIGMCLAAPYVMTAQFEGPYMNLEGTHSGEFDFHRWWLTQIQPLFDARTRLFLLTLVTIAFGALCIWVFRRNTATTTSSQQRNLKFLVSVAGGALFMTTQLSLPVWIVFPILQGLPFPTRFLQPFNVFVAGLAALAFPYLWSQRNKLVSAAAVLILLSWIAGDVWAGSMAYSVWRPFAVKQAEFYANVHRFDREYPAFWPKWTPVRQVNDFPAFTEFVTRHVPRQVTIANSTGSPAGSASVVRWEGRRIELAVQSPTPAQLTINHFYYPNWEGQIEGGPEGPKSISATPSPDGFIQMAIPAGTYRMTVKLERAWPEQVGLMVSALALLATALIVLWSARKAHPWAALLGKS